MSKLSMTAAWEFSFRSSARLSESCCWLLAVLLTFCLCLTGCRNTPEKPDKPTPEETSFVPDPLTMLVVGEPEIGDKIARQWAAQRDGKLTIVNQTIDQFVESDFEIGAEIDVVVYPPVMMGDLASRKRLQPVPQDLWVSPKLNRNELLRHYRTLILRRSQQAFAVPLGNPQFTLLCNRKLFDELGFEPPATWEQLEKNLNKIDEYLSSTDKQDSNKLTPKIDMPLAQGWAANVFLARVAPEIRYRGKLSTVFDRRTLKPLIANPPFVDALKQLKRISTKRSLELNPGAVFRLANSGQSSLAIGWPASGFRDGEETEAESGGSDQDTLMIRSLPGSDRWFDPKYDRWVERNPEEDKRAELIGFAGLVASVSETSPNDTAAWEFLEWLPSKSHSLVTMVDSPALGPFRASHLGDVSRWTGEAISLDTADEFAEVVSSIHERKLVLMFPRIPGQHQYRAALDQALRDYLSGASESPEQALQKVADQWESLTDSIGRKRQIREHRAAAGL